MAGHTIPFGRGGTKKFKKKYEYERYHFSFDFQKILVLRSHTPLLLDLCRLISQEFPGCVVDILQVPGSAPLMYPDEVSVRTIYAADSKKGFLVRYLVNHYLTFKDQRYDAVFLLYGVDRDSAKNYNLDLYGMLTPSRYCIVYDINGKFRIINSITFIQRTLKYIWSRCVLLINLWATFFMILYIVVWMIVLSPVALFGHRSRR